MTVRVIGKYTWGLQLIDISDGRRIDMPKEQLEFKIECGLIRPGMFYKGKIFVILQEGN